MVLENDKDFVNMENDNLNQEIDYDNATNKELEAIIKETEEKYKIAQSNVVEQYSVMSACAEIYNKAFTVLDKRLGGRLTKKRNLNKEREENGNS